MLIIDRFEGGFAVLEDENGRPRNVPRGLFPSDAREGDAVFLRGGRYEIDRELTTARREKIKKLAEGLFNDMRREN